MRWSPRDAALTAEHGVVTPSRPGIEAGRADSVEARIAELTERMTLGEKLGQMNLVRSSSGTVSDGLGTSIREGRVGGVLNEVDVDTVNELQRIAVNESRLGIPLLIGRDVIHGFSTIFPIPLGQAASWNPRLVEDAARAAALEAAAAGVNWTFGPMIDVSRDPRWGRIAESLGEDPYLTGVLGTAMVRGFQGSDLSAPGAVAACAKHFAGYGASESGRDYNTVNVSENELRNVYLPPFKALLDAGVASFMTAFCELNGVPASANELLLKQILRKEWRFDGLVVSDWDSIPELAAHGFTAGDRESAAAAVAAGIDMEMHSTTYAEHLQRLVEEGEIAREWIDAMVGNVLRTKFRLGLFHNAYTEPKHFPRIANDDHLALARKLACESIVLLKNDHATLPLSTETVGSLAVIGPLADAPEEQLGTWALDGDPRYCRTGLQAIREIAGGAVEIRYAKAMDHTRSRAEDGFGEAVELAAEADATVLFLGEESLLSGEARCRADIGLPGGQEALIERLGRIGKPLILVVMAGRPLTLGNVIDQVDAVLYAWHPGTLGGAAIADVLFGVVSPSGKLPVTLPRAVGQIPIYYAHKNTGRPPTPESFVHIDDMEPRTPQLTTGNASFHLDAGFTPLFPFGYGMSYAAFEYSDIQVSSPTIRLGESVAVSARLTNVGEIEAEEVAQLYVRDLVGNVTRPVKELKGFRKVRLAPGKTRRVAFELHTEDLAFFGRDMRLVTEPGEFHAWIGGSSASRLRIGFRVVDTG